MIKALFLIFDPVVAWEGAAGRRLSFTVLFYLLPMMAIVGAVEGFSLVEWGRTQSPLGEIKKFTPGEALLSEAAQMALMILIVLLSAYFIKALGETFHGRHTYRQTFTVVIYGLSPIFLLRLLDAVPKFSLWIPWIIGVMLMIKVLYHGVPLVMRPDPPHAFGLFFMSSLLLTLVTGAERIIATGYLAGRFRPVSDMISHFAAKLHL